MNTNLKKLNFLMDDAPINKTRNTLLKKHKDGEVIVIMQRQEDYSQTFTSGIYESLSEPKRWQGYYNCFKTLLNIKDAQTKAQQNRINLLILAKITATPLITTDQNFIIIKATLIKSGIKLLTPQEAIKVIEQTAI